MSIQNDPQFDKLRRLLALKRYQRPPPQYFENFLDEFHRRQRAEPIRVAGWWERFVELLRGEPLLIARYALATAALVLLCLNAYFISHPTAASHPPELASAQPGWTPTLPPEVFAQRTMLVASNAGPHYVLDRVNIAPASYDSVGDF
jgi:hypothetical protein